MASSAAEGLHRPRLLTDVFHTQSLETYKDVTNSLETNFLELRLTEFARKKSVFLIYYTDCHKWAFLHCLNYDGDVII